MKFDPATLLTTAFLTLLLFGLVLATVVKRSRQDPAGLWWIASFLLGAVGFLLLILMPAEPGALLIAANTLFLSAYGCCHAATRALFGRRPSDWSLATALAVWPLVCSVFDPGFDTRVQIASLLVCGYSTATAFEFARGATKDERSRFLAAALCAAHALFYLVRAISGPTFGFVNASAEAVISGWGAAIALEIVLFAAALAILVVGITLERARLEDRRAAYTDFLTGVGSRRAFEAAMRTFIPAADNHVPTILLLLDLDEFKKVNDSLGHEAGDHLLKAFATVIRQRLADPAMFWRLGGDEFAVLLRGCELREAEAVKETLRKAIDTSAANQRMKGVAHVSVSIGSAAVIPGETMLDLLRRADTALYQDKRNRRRFDPALLRDMATDQGLDRRLLR